jgi:hypothetical protein
VGRNCRDGQGETDGQQLLFLIANCRLRSPSSRIYAFIYDYSIGFLIVVISLHEPAGQSAYWSIITAALLLAGFVRRSEPNTHTNTHAQRDTNNKSNYYRHTVADKVSI